MDICRAFVFYRRDVIVNIRVMTHHMEAIATKIIHRRRHNYTSFQIWRRRTVLKILKEMDGVKPAAAQFHVQRISG